MLCPVRFAAGTLPGPSDHAWHAFTRPLVQMVSVGLEDEIQTSFMQYAMSIILVRQTSPSPSLSLGAVTPLETHVPRQVCGTTVDTGVVLSYFVRAHGAVEIMCLVLGCITAF